METEARGPGIYSPCLAWPPVFPKGPLELHILFHKGIIARAVFLITIFVGSFKGKANE